MPRCSLQYQEGKKELKELKELLLVLCSKLIYLKYMQFKPRREAGRVLKLSIGSQTKQIHWSVGHSTLHYVRHNAMGEMLHFRINYI